MNKEECLKAKEVLRMANDYPTSEYNDSGLINDAINSFGKLIREHFDNPPLKFEELEVGMWVWDNKHKVYNQIYCLNENFMSTKHNLVQFKHLNETTQWGDTIEFEENRFYRKQVEE